MESSTILKGDFISATERKIEIERLTALHGFIDDNFTIPDDKFIIYHLGYLPVDRRCDRILEKRASEIMGMLDVILIQKRIAPMSYVYLVKRKTKNIFTM